MIKKRDDPLINLFLGVFIGVVYGALWMLLFELMVMAEIKLPFDDRVLYLPMFLLLVVLNVLIGGEKFSVVFRTVIAAPIAFLTQIFILLIQLGDAFSEF